MLQVPALIFWLPHRFWKLPLKRVKKASFLRIKPKSAFLLKKCLKGVSIFCNKQKRIIFAPPL